jgi:hypothetical protein
MRKQRERPELTEEQRSILDQIEVAARRTTETRTAYETENEHLTQLIRRAMKELKLPARIGERSGMSESRVFQRRDGRSHRRTERLIGERSGMSESRVFQRRDGRS